MHGRNGPESVVTRSGSPRRRWGTRVMPCIGPTPKRLSTPFHKYDHVCGEGFLAQTRRERRAYPSGVCKERATTSGPKRTAARRVASLFGSGVVAPRSQPHCGGCSLVAPRQNRKSTQQTWSYL